MSKKYTLCSCRHSDDDHQSLQDDFVPLKGQRICYGDSGLCECERWQATARVHNYRIVKSQRTLFEGIERLSREGRYYEWV